MADDRCLHCDINDLVQEHIGQGEVDMTAMAAKMAESLADLVLMAPETEQAKLMADVLAYFGQVFLEKSGAIDGDGGGAKH